MEVKKMEQAQYLKIEAEIAKLMAETTKIHAETRWYPWIAGSGGLVAVLGLLLNFWK